MYKVKQDGDYIVINNVCSFKMINNEEVEINFDDTIITEGEAEEMVMHVIDRAIVDYLNKGSDENVW